MIPAMQNAIASMLSTVRGVTGVAITYTRVSDGSVKTLSATPGATSVEADFGDGVIRQEKLGDFIVDAADLGFEPESGDTITMNEDLYEVVYLPGQKHFDEIGPYKQAYRIHTKQVYGS